MAINKKMLLKCGIILAVAFLLDNYILSFICAIAAQGESLSIWATVSDICASLDSIMPFAAITVTCLSLYGINPKKDSTMHIVGINLLAFLIVYLLKSTLEINRIYVYITVIVLCAVSFTAVYLSIKCIGKPNFAVKPLIIGAVMLVIFAAAYIWQGNAEITLAEQSVYTTKSITLSEPPFYVSLFYYLALLFSFAGMRINNKDAE